MSGDRDVAGRPALDRACLLQDLIDGCGLHRGDVLIVHSSLRAIGWIDGGAATLIQALTDALGDNGTLLMPTFSAPQADGRFDVRRTPSRTGRVTEVFRTLPGVRRSLHPTHSVAARGPLADVLTRDHLRTSGLGPDSPLDRAAQAGARVLMIGCDLRACSLIHVAEARCQVPYLGHVWYPGYDRPLTAVDDAGRAHPYVLVDQPLDSQGFGRVQRLMAARDLIRHGQLGDAPCLIFDGRACLDTAGEMLSKDPHALLCDNGHCAICTAARAVPTERATPGPGSQIATPFHRT